MATKIIGLRTLSAAELDTLDNTVYERAENPFQEGAIFTISEITSGIHTWEDRHKVTHNDPIFIFHLKEVENEISSDFIIGSRAGWTYNGKEWIFSNRNLRMGTMNISIRNYLNNKEKLTIGELKNYLNNILKNCTFRCNYKNLTLDPRDPYRAENITTLLEFNWEKDPVETKEGDSEEAPY